MRHNYTQPQSPKTYTRLYAGFRGIDLANAPIHVDPSRSPNTWNVIVDAAGVVHKRPPFVMRANYGGLRTLESAVIHGIYTFIIEESTVRAPGDQHTMLVHVGTKLYMYRGVSNGSLPSVVPTTLCTNLNDADSSGFQHDKKFYILDGKAMRVVMEDEATEQYVVKTVQEIATAPETQIDGYYYAEEYTDENDAPQVAYTWKFGEKGERNLLTARRVNTFAGDGVNTKFYMDKPNMHVTKVEMYSPTVTSAGAGDTVTTISYAASNVRNKPSQERGQIIGSAPANTTYTTYGKQGKWYQIEFPSYSGDAYIHQDRVATYTAGGGTTTVVSNIDEWVEITTGFTVREADIAAPNNDEVANCTVIVFDTAPSAHPLGSGLPNIRVTGAETEECNIDVKQPDGAGQSNLIITIPLSERFVDVTSGTRFAETVKINSGNALTRNTDYIVEAQTDGSTKITVYGVVNNVQHLHSGDVVYVKYFRELMRDFAVINLCDKHGKYGIYNRDRFFFTGNPGDLNRDWYSEPSDPTLVLENSFTEIGIEQNGIAGYLNFQSEQLIVKYDGETECLYRRTANTDNDGIVFPVKAYAGRGAANSHALVNVKGSALYLSPEGVMEFVSSDLGSKYSVQNRSYLINPAIRGSSGGQLGVWGDYLLVTLSDGTMFVGNLNSPTAPSEGGSFGYEWFRWSDVSATLMHYAFDVLWFRRNESDLCSIKPHAPSDHFADYPDGTGNDPYPIMAVWSTPCDMLDEPTRYKYIERRGAMVNLVPMTHEGSVVPQRTIKYAIVTDGKNARLNTDGLVDQMNEPTDYDVINLGASLYTPVVLPCERINRFRYVQFMFANDTPYTDGIEILSLEFQYRFGRYVI